MTDVGADRLGPGVDDVYDELIQAHAGLSLEESARLNARLVLILMNAVGDVEALRAILHRARAAVSPPPAEGSGH